MLARTTCDADPGQIVGSRPVTVARVPTAMNTGVSTRPCRVTNEPRRARDPLLTAETEKPRDIAAQCKAQRDETARRRYPSSFSTMSSTNSLDP